MVTGDSNEIRLRPLGNGLNVPITEKVPNAIIEECWHNPAIDAEFQYEDATGTRHYEGVIDLVGQNNGTQRPADLSDEEILDALLFDWTIWDKDTAGVGFPSFL